MKYIRKIERNPTITDDPLFHTSPQFLLLPWTVFYIMFNPFPHDKILDSSKLNEFAEDNFKFNENDRQFSKWVENTVEK